MTRLRIHMLLLSALLMLSACSSDSDSVATATTPQGGSVQGKSLELSGSVVTFAGPAPGALDGTGTAARFEKPVSLASDGANIYIADPGNHTIRKMVISTGEVTTLAGKPGVPGALDGTGSGARFSSPGGITTDGSSLYVADSSNYTIRKVVIATGEVKTIAGSAGSRGNDDGTGAAARFNSIEGITTDGTNLYVADYEMIRKVELATRVVTTLAGGSRQYPEPSTLADGVGPSARFMYIRGITTDGTNLFVTDNSTIRKVVIATADVTTIAGSDNSYGAVDGTGVAARFMYPAGITTDGSDIYIADGNAVRRMVIDSAQLTTIAGQPWQAGYVDGLGPQARFNNPMGMVAVGPDLFVADPETKVIRKIVKATGAVTTATGTPFIGSADGPAPTATFFYPMGITTDGSSLFIVDRNNYAIRKIDLATKIVTTLAGTSGQGGYTDGTGGAARFGYPQGITTDGAYLYVTDYYRLRRVQIATGVVTTLAASGNWESGGTGAKADFNYLSAITTDGTSLFAIDNTCIKKISIATGEVTTLAGSPYTSGWADGPGADATFGWAPGGITTDGTRLFVADRNLIRMVTIATGEVTTIAGRSDYYYYWGATDGYGTSATFSSAQGITTDGVSLFIADNGNSGSIRKLVIATGEVTTIAGGASRFAENGVGGAAGFVSPTGITTDGRSLYLTDGIGLIRRID